MGGFLISISEILIIALVYGGLFLYLNNVITRKLKNSYFTAFRYILVLMLYSFTISLGWLMFKGEEYHRNEHSGLEDVSYRAPALFFIASITLYSVMLFFLGKYKRKINIGDI